ncbi:MAG: SDR family oxidoreductase [Actinobacteria bacterium ATB1]|nr:SDR family oxidoreductase [Actinobacteria bacterium ATB1]
MTTSGASDWKRALVTGASSGIGLALASHAAARGLDVVLVARSETALEKIASDLEKAHGIRAEVLAADLTSTLGVERVQDRLRSDEDPVDLLVNNAGFGWHGAFVDQEQDDAEGQIRLNVTALVDLSHTAARVMADRKRGGILNVASIGGHTPSPGFAVYGATKAFVVNFTLSLHDELRTTGVHVTTLSPGLTRTGFQERAEVRVPRLPSMAWTTPEEVAEAGLAGVFANRALVVPGIVNRVVVGSARLLPPRVAARAGALLVPHRGASSQG